MIEQLTEGYEFQALLNIALVDWRNLARWSLADRKRECHVASVSSNCTYDPFGEREGTETLVAQAPAFLYRNGEPVSDIAREAYEEGFDLIEGARRVIWSSEPGTPLPLAGASRRLLESTGKDLAVVEAEGEEATTANRYDLVALNLARRRVARWLGIRMAAEYTWASGWHIDYATTLSWILHLRYPDPFWDAWQVGIKFLIDAARSARPDWRIVAQQFSRRWYLDGADGLFLEQAPTRFGVPLTQHKRDMLAMAELNPDRKPLWIVELLEPWLSSPTYREATRQFSIETGAYLSEGRQ